MPDGKRKNPHGKKPAAKADRPKEKKGKKGGRKQALIETLEYYRALVENLPVGVYRNTPGPEGRFVMANPALARMHGYDSLEEFLQVRVADLYWDPAERAELSRKLSEQGALTGEVVRLRRKDGTALWAS
ncbi:MAG: PAS domain-containing protein, partial [Armatimonadota bacterium]|nr:PAS domain-containing protein [Armatimonadota bacterium]